MSRAVRTLSAAVVLSAVSAVPAAAVPAEWQSVGAGITSGVSGAAVIARDGDRVEALIVRDNKQPSENRAARVVYAGGRVADVQPLRWVGAEPVDLEAVEPIPGTGNEYIALASDGSAFRVRLESGQVSVLAQFSLPKGDGEDNYESFALAPQDGGLVAVWADRGGDKRPATIYSAEFDPQALTFGSVHSVEFQAPAPDQNVRHASDAEVTPEGGLVVSSASDTGDDGPFESVVYRVGELAGGRVELASKPAVLGEYPDHKIEALARLSDSADDLLLGTDDENGGGWVRTSR